MPYHTVLQLVRYDAKLRSFESNWLQNTYILPVVALNQIGYKVRTFTGIFSGI